MLRWIGEHCLLENRRGQIVPDRQGEQVDDLIVVRPDEIGTENPLRPILDHHIKP